MLRGINGLNSVNAGGTVDITRTAKQENLNSVFDGRQSNVKQDPYKDFNNALKDSPVGNKFLDAKTLETQGWVKEPIMDMNGGIYYKNPETGAKVRVQEDSHFRKSNTYQTKEMNHFVRYNDDGKPAGGVVQIKQSDGSIKVYEYETDVSGNKFIKSVKTSEFDYFADYD